MFAHQYDSMANALAEFLLKHPKACAHSPHDLKAYGHTHSTEHRIITLKGLTYTDSFSGFNYTASTNQYHTQLAIKVLEKSILKGFVFCLHALMS